MKRRSHTPAMVGIALLVLVIVGIALFFAAMSESDHASSQTALPPVLTEVHLTAIAIATQE